MKSMDDNLPLLPPAKEQLMAKARMWVGWHELLKALAERAESEPGKARCAEPELGKTLPACEIMLSETDEMVSLYRGGESPPPTPINDVAHLVELARAEGTLEGEDLVKVMNLLSFAARAANFYSALPRDARLRQWAQRLSPLPAFLKKLKKSIDADGAVLDGASPELGSLRSGLRTLRQRVHRRLNELVARNEGAVLQDDFYTQRNNRYVVPVKASQQDRFKGIVHDASASGQTVFIEPSELVEPNNRIRLAEAEIEAEARRILRELSRAVKQHANEILENMGVLAHLDAVRARARLAKDLEAARPALNDSGIMNLKAARHPLLVLRGHEVVPNDLELGGERTVLVISGPNAGGKTVGLCTLGLFALMVRAGMFITADPDSGMAVFEEVYAVLGDEQDVSKDLSTFSSHMLDVIGILRAAGPNSLILLDELMGSTDPEEGSALAAAALSRLRRQGAVVAATTHLPALKSFAHGEPGFLNAGYAFDPHTLSPTYKLVVGVPGQSLGIDVARRLGLEEDLVEKARTEVGGQARRMESLLAEISSRLSELDRQAREAAQEKRRLERTMEEYRELRHRAEEHEREAKRLIKSKVREAVREAEHQLENIVEPVKRRRAPARDEVLRARERIREFKKELDRRYGEDEPLQAEPIDWARAQKSDRVMVLPLKVEAVLTDVPEGEIKNHTEIQVMMGKVKARVPAERIMKLPETGASGAKEPRPPASRKRPESPITVQRDDQAAAASLPPADNNTLDVRGKRAAEAEAEVDEFLDRACRRNLPNVFIIHGHGTGALKRLVREQLGLSPYVESFRPGERGEGGDGVTMAVLKDLGSA